MIFERIIIKPKSSCTFKLDLHRRADGFSKFIRAATDTRMNKNKILYPEFNKNNNTNTTANKRKNGGIRIYPNIEKAIDTRVETARFSPGNQSISREAAKVLVERAVKKVDKDGGSDAVSFIHDPRYVYNLFLKNFSILTFFSISDRNKSP